MLPKRYLKLLLYFLDACLVFVIALIVLSMAYSPIKMSLSKAAQNDFRNPPRKITNLPFDNKFADPKFLDLSKSGNQYQFTLLNLINSERQKINIPVLTLDNNLSLVALYHSRDMAEKNYFSHNNPEGVTPFQRLAKASINFQTAGENIADAPSINSAHSNLMQSTQHRDNILNSAFRKIGIGIIRKKSSNYLLTEIFTD